MNKVLPYFIAGVAVLLLVWLVFSTRANRHEFDDRLSFNRRDKIPYGMNVAYSSLSHIFPGASIEVNRKEPAAWGSLNSGWPKKTLIAIVPTFRADEYDMKALVDFIKNGNSVFISTAVVSYDAQTMLRCEIPDVYDIGDNLVVNNNSDSFSVSLAEPPFSKQDEFGCPGKRFESYFSKYDSGISEVLGNGIYILPNLIEFKAGKGSLFLHLTPLAFSNYFLLYGNNMSYYDKVFSLIPRDTQRIIWDEYFLNKRSSRTGGDNKSILSALMSQRSFRAALWVLVTLLLLFVFQELRRKQRLIPYVARPRNDSLEFVKTIGRLYFEKRDNKNLSRKMAAYFLEHVRNQYKLSTSTLDDEFVAALQRKTLQPETLVKELVSFINRIDGMDAVTDEEISTFHKRLEEFYKSA